MTLETMFLMKVGQGTLGCDVAVIDSGATACTITDARKEPPLSRADPYM